jgi:Fe2+ transport system protein FeoA
MATFRPPTLDSLAAGASGTVAAVGDEHASQLAREGIALGTRFAIEATAPFGGPLIVRVGRARVALARRVARTIEVETGPVTAP